MNLHINLTINFNTTHTRLEEQKENKPRHNVFDWKTQELIAALQKEVDRIAAETKDLSKTVMLIRASKSLKVPIVVRSIEQLIKYPKSYKYSDNKNRRTLSENERHDIASLIMGGVRENVVSVLVETSCSSIHTAVISERMKSITKKDVEMVREKYKDLLMLYSVYDTVIYNKNNLRRIKPRQALSLETTFSKTRRFSYTPDQVQRFVDVYESLPVSDTATLKSDMKEVMRLCNVSMCAPSMKRLLFAHAHVKGYEHIPVPDVKNFIITPASENVNVQLVEEIRYLRDTKLWSVAKISRILGLDRAYVQTIYYAIVRPDIKVSSEMKRIFDKRYKGVK